MTIQRHTRSEAETWISPDQVAFSQAGGPSVDGQAAQVGQRQGLVPLVPALPSDGQGPVEVAAGLWDPGLAPETQGQQVVDHPSLRGAVGPLEMPVIQNVNLRLMTVKSNKVYRNMTFIYLS